MKQSTHQFKRFFAFMAGIATIMQQQSLPRKEALMLSPAYKSRGKGKGKVNGSLHCVAQDKRAAKKARNIQRHRAACKG